MEDLVRMVTLVFHGGLGQHLLDPESVAAGSIERRLLPVVVAAVTAPADRPRSAR